jgi:acyl dehydratase
MDQPGAIGAALPPIVFGPVTRAMLALYAGASGDHNPIHIDSDFARGAGKPDVFAHGMLSFGLLARLVTGWCGIERLRGLHARFVAITELHDTISCTGEIVGEIERDGERLMRLAVAASTGEGRRTLIGEALVTRW